MAAPSTKQKLLSLIEDVEIVSKELFEVISHPTKSKDVDTHKLVELLIHKDKEIKATQELAKEQAGHQERLNALKQEVELRDYDIRQLQHNLKEAEQILANALYEAKQKLKSIDQANRNKVSPDELIKYAHKISSSNSVAAPPTWVPGDPRRPYPTEIDMRHSLLAKMNDMSHNTHASSVAGTDASTKPTDQHLNAQHQTGANTSQQLSWQQQLPGLGSVAGTIPSGGLSNVSQPSGGYDHKQLHNKETDDVEMMSTDSSSSSGSSDDCA